MKFAFLVFTIYHQNTPHVTLFNNTLKEGLQTLRPEDTFIVTRSIYFLKIKDKAKLCQADFLSNYNYSLLHF